MDSQEIPLSAVPGVPEGVLRKLKARWVSSADQLVALGTSATNIKALAQELGLDETETHRILDAAKAVLGPEKSADLQRPVDTSRYPLGVEKPKG
jgi:methylphosphotriester-DNA--protein-cysteine methyltransferase